MLTQTIMVNLTQSKLSAIIMRAEEKGREIQFEVFNEAGEAVDLNDYAVKFIMLKPDENIVMTDAVNGVVTQTEQMTTAKGAGYYCIRLIDDDTVVYSGQGKVLIDDHVVEDETLQSISEVDGLIFPDDFLTTDSPVALINDTDTSADTTWSSSKISNEIDDHSEIDDNITSSSATWSSSKISDEISDAIGSIDIPPAREYSAAEKVVGKWFNQDLYAITYHDSYTSPGSGAHTTQHDLPGDIKLVEPHYIRYIYSGGVYMLIGNQITQYLNINTPESPSPTYFNATQTVGNVDQTDIYYTIYYTKEG